MQIVRRLGYKFRQHLPHAAEFFGAPPLLALRVVRHADVVRLVGGQIEIFHALVGIDQILKHAKHELVGIRIGGAQLVIAVGIFA